MLRLQVLPEDLPAQLDAPALAGRATGGASSVGSLGDLQPLGVAAVTEQLRADVAERRSGEAHTDRRPCCSFASGSPGDRCERRAGSGSPSRPRAYFLSHTSLGCLSDRFPLLKRRTGCTAGSSTCPSPPHKHLKYENISFCPPPGADWPCSPLDFSFCRDLSQIILS